MRDDAYRKGAHVPESAARGLFSRHWRGSHSERGSHLRLQSEHVEILSRASTSEFFQWAGYSKFHLGVLGRCVECARAKCNKYCERVS